MSIRLHHPLWTHSPALACIAINCALLLSTRLPARVPTHFGRLGRPDSWGSPLDIWLMMVALPLLLVMGSAALDEWYARHEQGRRFNWASLLDELAVGFLTGVYVKTIPQLSSPDPVLSGQIAMAHLFTGGAVALAALLEWIRPYRPGIQEGRVEVEPLARSIQSQFKPDGCWLYWEKENTLLWRGIVILTTILFAGAAGDAASKSVYGGVLLYIIAVFMACGYGGFCVAVTPGRLTLRSWIFGLTFLRLKLANVQSVEVMNFDALADFLGWGLYKYSLSLRAWGFVLGGKRGVMIHMKSGRKFFISSHSSEKLAAAAEAARIAAAQ